MDTLERLNKIKLKNILLKYPFYGYFLIKIKFELDENIPTAQTNGKVIVFNPAFVDKLSDKQVVTVIVHELKHIIFLHLFRINGRDLYTWNQATDYVINNQLIYEERLAPIKGLLLDSNYNGKAPEEIYKILNQSKQQKESKDGNNNKNSKGDSGQSRKTDTKSDSRGGKEKQTEGTEGDKEENKESRQTNKRGKKSDETRIGDFTRPAKGVNTTEEVEKIKEEITRAEKYAERAGKMPGNLKREIDKLMKPTIRWETLLANWLFEKAQDDYSWTKRNDRILDYFFPSLDNESLGKLAIVIDVSGSINRGLYTRFITEINRLKQRYKFECLMISFDTHIQNKKFFTEHEEIKFETRGGGGTNITPVFDLLKKEVNIKGCIVFTDMYISGLQSLTRPSFDVLWMNSTKTTYSPFGRVINIK